MDYGILILVCITCVFLIIIVCSICFSIKWSEYFNNSDQKVTLIILNHLRPNNLEISLPILKYIKNIDQIIVSHGSPKGFKEFNGVDNIKDYENNEKYGAGRRYLLDLNKIKNDLVITMDDDHILTPGILERMLLAARNDPNQIYGVHSRRCDETGYDWGPKDINTILTGLAMTSKTVIKTFQQHFHEIGPILSKYNGNGEDLAFNWIFRKYYKKNPIYIAGDFIGLDNTNGYSSESTHIEKRHSICKELSKLQK